MAANKKATGDPQMGATNLVQQMEDNSVVDILKASAMNKEIQKVTEKWFDLAQKRARYLLLSLQSHWLQCRYNICQRSAPTQGFHSP